MVKDLEVGRLFWNIWLGPRCITCIHLYMKAAKADLIMDRRRGGNVTPEEEEQPQPECCWQLSGAGKGKE